VQEDGIFYTGSFQGIKKKSIQVCALEDPQLLEKVKQIIGELIDKDLPRV